MATKKTATHKNKSKLSQKAGMAPGSIVHIGERKTDAVSIDMFRYNSDNVEYVPEIKPEKLALELKKDGDLWVNVIGLHDTEVISKIGENLKLHHLILEDIVNTTQRPKYEEYEENSYVVLKMLSYDSNAVRINQEQVSFVLGSGYVVSFQEMEGDVFGRVRDRLNNPKSRLRKSGSDYLLYALIDAIVDNYFFALEAISEDIEILEEAIVIGNKDDATASIYALKRALLSLTRSVWPVRELLAAIIKDESTLVGDEVIPYFKDIYDHSCQIIDSIESYRDSCLGLQDIHNSNLSNKMNQVMKVLTVIATLFIPLTFVAGIYGMNFEFMPELHWRWSYPAVWGIMISIGVWMLWWFRKNKWL